MDLFNLEGRIALVTGCARGLGREIAVGLARNGASLILADTVEPAETSERIEQVGSRSISVQVDISEESAVETLAEKAISAFKKVDILINNAGISQLSYTPSEELPVEEWDRIIRVNLRGTFLCCKTIGKHMIRNGGGNIVNIATTAGITGVPRAPAYSASKAGVILLTKSLAVEWARHNIRVNAIAPHYLATPLTEGLRNSEKLYGALLEKIPMKRFGETSEMIGPVLLLSSDASSYITGVVFPVDGGYLAQ